MSLGPLDGLVASTQARPVHPIEVWCHLCHAQCGSPCNWQAEYHDRRIGLAKTITKLRRDFPDTWTDHPPGGVDIEHAIACGDMCVPHVSNTGFEKLCSICGQDIERLRSIRPVVEEFELKRTRPLILPHKVSNPLAPGHRNLVNGDTIELVRTFTIPFGAFAKGRDPAMFQLFNAWDADRVKINPSDYVLDEVSLVITSWLPRIDQTYGDMTSKILRKKKYAPFFDPEGVAYHMAHKPRP